jgi:hypothetical protein
VKADKRLWDLPTHTITIRRVLDMPAGRERKKDGIYGFLPDIVKQGLSSWQSVSFI